MDPVIISADSHVMEPADLWTARLPRSLRQHAPEVRRNENGKGWLFHAPGLPASTVSGSWGAGVDRSRFQEHLENAGYETARPSGWDPVERLKDQDVDGVHAEVLYGTLGMRLFRMSDAALQRAIFAVYNDWLAEFCSHAPARLHGLGLVSLWDVGEGVRELERCAELGMKGAMIWASPPVDRPYQDPSYDPVWAAAQALGMPLSLHIVSGMGEESRVDFRHAAIRYMHMIHEVQRSISAFVLGGVLERFPGLNIVAAECEVAWLPHWMQRMDHAQQRFGPMMEVPLSLSASDYVRRQVWVTFLDDALGAEAAERFGQDTFMWGNDFPHGDSTWPHSKKVIERCLGGAPAEAARKILHDNAASLYRITI